MNAFTFGDDAAKNRTELDRFETVAGAWKPPGYDDECRLRLDYYLYRQKQDLLAAILKRYPETHADVEPYAEMVPVTRFFVNEQAKVFLNGADLDLATKDGEALPADDKRKVRWAEVQEEMGLGLRLKMVDRYTVLNRTCFLRIGSDAEGGMRALVFLPESVDVAWDPAYPFDLDRAFGVRLRIAGDPAEKSKLVGADGKTPAGRPTDRWEFWCGRKGEEQYRILAGDGGVVPVDGLEGGKNPYGLVPAVMFTAHTEELGAFTLANQGLHLFNRAIDVLVTDLHHIAASQGFGQLVISYKEGMDGQQKIVAGPARAIELKDGATAEVLSPSPQIASLVELVDQDLKRQAVLHGIPPGAVSLEARAVASGISLQIELRPLMELRQDAIDVYRAPMKRLWRVCQVVHDGATGVAGPKLGADIQARWQPGDVQLPSDPQVELDLAVDRVQNDFSTPAQELARMDGIPLEEAEKRYQDNQKANAGARAARRAPGPGEGGAPGLAAAARAAVPPPGTQRRGQAAAE